MPSGWGMEGRSRGLRLGGMALGTSFPSRAFTSESSQHLGNPPTRKGGVVGIKPEDSDESDKGGMTQDEYQTV